MAEFVLSEHTKEELKRRAIPEALLREVLDNPQQTLFTREGREIYQSILEFPDGNTFLLRVILTKDTSPPTVITVYRTRKINKYWRQP